MTIARGCSIFVISNGKFYVNQRSSTTKSYPNFYQLPGGKVEANEDPLTAATRELLEETGLNLTLVELTSPILITDPKHPDKQYMVYTYIGNSTLPPQNLEPDKGSGWFAVSLEEAKALTPLLPSMQLFLNSPNSKVLNNYLC